MDIRQLITEQAATLSAFRASLGLAEPTGELAHDLAESRRVPIRVGVAQREFRAMPDAGEGVVEVIASTDGVKRDGNRVRNDGWSFGDFRRNPAMTWCHDWTVPLIGSWLEESVVPYQGGRALKLVGRFALFDDFAARIYKLYANNVMRTWSIEWTPDEYEELLDAEGRRIGWDFVRNTLLGCAAVPMPADPEAITLAVRTGALTPEEATGFHRMLKRDASHVYTLSHLEPVAAQSCGAEAPERAHAGLPSSDTRTDSTGVPIAASRIGELNALLAEAAANIRISTDAIAESIAESIIDGQSSPHETATATPVSITEPCTTTTQDVGSIDTAPTDGASPDDGAAATGGDDPAPAAATAGEADHARAWCQVAAGIEGTVRGETADALDLALDRLTTSHHGCVEPIEGLRFARSVLAQSEDDAYARAGGERELKRLTALLITCQDAVDEMAALLGAGASGEQPEPSAIPVMVGESAAPEPEQRIGKKIAKQRLDKLLACDKALGDGVSHLRDVISEAEAELDAAVEAASAPEVSSRIDATPVPLAPLCATLAEIGATLPKPRIDLEAQVAKLRARAGTQDATVARDTKVARRKVDYTRLALGF